MISAQRREEIKRILLAKKSVTVAEIAEHFSISTETVRRDFEHLKKEGFLEKSYGGATLKSRVSYIVPQQIKSEILVENKRRMTKRAAAFLSPGDSIFLDHSTTVYEMCREIENIPLTVMTNSLYVVNHFARKSNISLVIPGGSLNVDAQGFFGLETLEFLKRHYLDKAFLSCRAINMKQGLCDSGEASAALRRTIIDHAGTVYLFADHTKLSKPSFIKIAGFEEIDCILTDSVLPGEWTAYLRGKNVQIVECVQEGEKT